MRRSRLRSGIRPSLEQLESRRLLAVAQFSFSGHVDFILPPVRDSVELGGELSGTFEYDLEAPNDSFDPANLGIYQGVGIQFDLGGEHYACSRLDIYVAPAADWSSITLSGSNCNQPENMAIHLWKGSLPSSALPASYDVQEWERYLFWQTLEDWDQYPSDGERGFFATLDRIDRIGQTVDVSISGFTHQTRDELRVDYTLDSEVGEEFTLQFYSSDDSTLDRKQDSKLGYELVVSPESLASNSALRLLNESNDRAWKQGKHTLLFKPQGSSLEAALQDSNAETIWAAFEDSTGASLFRGMYQSGAGAPAVVRTGPGNDNVIQIGPQQASFQAGSLDKSSTFVNAPALLVMAGDGKDQIHLDGSFGDENSRLHLVGATGKDTYQFSGAVQGNVRIDEPSGDSIDVLDFQLFAGSGIYLELDSKVSQAVAPGLAIQLEHADAIENVWGTPHDDRILGNRRENTLHGGAGNDILIGSLGNDELRGEAGRDVLLGDGFQLNTTDWRKLIGNLSSFSFSSTITLEVALVPSGNGEDKLYGGSEDDLIIGGDNADIIQPESGNSVVLGDSFRAAAGVKLDFSTITSGAIGTTGFFTLEQAGVGNDKITLVDGSNLVIAGDGNDEVVGSPTGIDLLFGDAGTDFINGRNGTNLIVGGLDDDRRPPDAEHPEGLPGLVGGADLDIIVGDDLTYSGSFPDLSMVNSPKAAADALVDFFASFDVVGNGMDVIATGDGINLAVGGGGNDVITGGNGLFDALFGSGGNDFIDGQNGTNLIVGGLDDDRRPPDAEHPEGAPGLVGGADVDIIVGDDLTYSGGFPDLSMVNSPKAAADTLVNFFASFDVVGTGMDVIATGDGFNLAIGGGGNDVITGGNGLLDALFGNAGSDSIDGLNGTNFIVGGDGSDSLLQGGGGTDVIFGDDFELPKSGEDDEFEFVELAGLTTAASYIKTFANLLKPGESPTPDEGPVETAFGLKLSGTGNDKIRAGGGNDLIIAGAGDDTDVDAGPGLVDLVYGNAGQDKLFGGPGIDMIVGGPDADVIDGGTDTDFNLLIGDSVTVDLGFDLSALLKGEFKDIGWPKIKIEFPDSGNDTLLGGNGIDLLIGGKGQDYLFGRQGTNIAFGDVFKGSAGPVGDIFSFAVDILDPTTSATAELVKKGAKAVYDFFKGSAGEDPNIDADQYFGGPGNDYVFGGDGDDLLWGDCKDPLPVGGVYLPVCNVPESGGRDFLVGGYGDDIIHAGPGGTEEDLDFFFGLIKIDEFGYGGPGDDTFYGSPGNDLLVSDEGTDTFYGGAGDDVLIGGPETDYFYGEEGNDLLFGQDGDDFLDGGPDNDQLFAGSGDDNLFGGDGDDMLHLGGGADVVDPGTGNDRIDPADFNQDGRIDAVDIDLLSAQTRSPLPDLQFDLTNDQLVNQDDREFLVRHVLGTYFGDADLNGRFDTSDLMTVLVAGEYEDSIMGNSSWADGDWNGDGEFGTGDIVIALQDGGYELSATVVAARQAPSQFLSSPTVAAAIDQLFLGSERRKRFAFVS